MSSMRRRIAAPEGWEQWTVFSTLTGRDIAALGVPPGRLRAALARAFRLHAEGRTFVEPKLTVAIAPGHFFQSLCAASPEPA